MLKQLKPTSPGRRNASVDAFLDITKSKPEKSLIVIRKQASGRNNQGKITVRHRGGGVRRYIRLVDFLQERTDSAKVLAIEYDPNRSSRIALVSFSDGTKRYIIAPLDLKVGDEVQSAFSRIEVKSGNRMPLQDIPIGQLVYNIELVPGQGGKIVRSAGNSAQLLAVEGSYAQLKMPSGEVRMVLKGARASIGVLSNPDHHLLRLGKAGRSRYLGRRPEVRGKAMNPVDHPHGGGEGRNPIGLAYPKTKWGRHALGVKTRKHKKYSDGMIIARRK